MQKDSSHILTLKQNNGSRKWGWDFLWSKISDEWQSSCFVILPQLKNKEKMGVELSPKIDWCKISLCDNRSFVLCSCYVSMFSIISSYHLFFPPTLYSKGVCFYKIPGPYIFIIFYLFIYYIFLNRIPQRRTLIICFLLFVCLFSAKR